MEHGISLEVIQEKCRKGNVVWSAHAATRLLQRGISRDDVINCILTGEIIEEYPEYWLNPACLIYGMTIKNTVLHVVVGLDDNVHIVTAYYPDTNTFMPDLKTRREGR